MKTVAATGSGSQATEMLLTRETPSASLDVVAAVTWQSVLIVVTDAFDSIFRNLFANDSTCGSQ
jgi:hypothetical protein